MTFEESFQETFDFVQWLFEDDRLEIDKHSLSLVWKATNRPISQSEYNIFRLIWETTTK